MPEWITRLVELYNRESQRSVREARHNFEFDDPRISKYVRSEPDQYYAEREKEILAEETRLDRRDLAQLKGCLLQIRLGGIEEVTNAAEDLYQAHLTDPTEEIGYFESHLVKVADHYLN